MSRVLNEGLGKAYKSLGKEVFMPRNQILEAAVFSVGSKYSTEAVLESRGQYWSPAIRKEPGTRWFRAQVTLISEVGSHEGF